MNDLIFNSDLYGKVALIPYPVQAGSSETLGFDTDILTSYTAQFEQRSKMRAIPRQSFTYAYDCGYDFMQKIYNAIYANIRGKWLIPLWFELQPITATVGQTSLAVDTSVHDIRANTYVLVYSNFKTWQVVKVSSITATTATVAALTIAGFAYVVPLRVGWFSAQSNMLPTGFANLIKGVFVVDDVLTGLTETVPQLNGLDFYSTPYLIDKSGSTQVFWDEDQSDFTTGNIAHSTAWANARYQKSYMFQDNGQAALRAFKNYFYRRAGKYRAFMSPTFEANLRSASSGIVGTTYKFFDDGYAANLYSLRKIVGFMLTDGTWQTRNILSVADLGDGTAQVVLDSALNIDANLISYCSFVAQNRLDADQISISFESFDMYRASINVMEITP